MTDAAADAVLAVDIGGTKVEFGLFDRHGVLVAHTRIPTPPGLPDAALPPLLDEARRLSAGMHIKAVGIDLPAVVSEGVIVWAAWSFPGWDGCPLATRWADAFAVPAILEFDGYAAALGEFWQGAARGFSEAVVVIVGTGVGGGVVHAGELYRGATGVAGAIGWMRFPESARLGVPMEEIASGTAILRRAQQAREAGAIPYGTTRDVFDARDRGDPIAEMVIREAMVALAAGVGAIVSMLAPQVVVLGGSVGSRPDVVKEVRQLVLETAQPHTVQHVAIVPARLGARSSLYGAGYIAHTFLNQTKESR
jgi:glucokinase